MSTDIVDSPSGRQGKPPLGGAGIGLLSLVVAAAVVLAVVTKRPPEPLLLAAAVLGGALVWFGLLSWTASSEQAVSRLVAGQAALDAEGDELSRRGDEIAAELKAMG